MAPDLIPFAFNICQYWQIFIGVYIPLYKFFNLYFIFSAFGE
jgi:hypothetical protein